MKKKGGLVFCWCVCGLGGGGAKEFEVLFFLLAWLSKISYVKTNIFRKVQPL